MSSKKRKRREKAKATLRVWNDPWIDFYLGELARFMTKQNWFMLYKTTQRLNNLVKRADYLPSSKDPKPPAFYEPLEDKQNEMVLSGSRNQKMD